MSKRTPSISLAAPPPTKAQPAVRSAAARLSYARRFDAQKQSLLALEQSLKLQSYTISLPGNRQLFSAQDRCRPVFPSVPSQIICIYKRR
jgi:hypothetical protein